MNKITMLLTLVIFASCANNRGPASIDGNPVAYDSMALGNVKAQAVKRPHNQEVCFDINLTAKNIEQSHASASNWTLAWIDKKDQYHLLSVNQRVPAATPRGGVIEAPYGAYNEFTNSFTTCAHKAQFEDVKALVLTPKELPFDKKDGLKLSWKE